jgi:hypothetical protein
MTSPINIRHFSYKVTTKPTKKGVEYALVNLVFDTTNEELFKDKAAEYTRSYVITDLDLYEEIIQCDDWLEKVLNEKPNERGFVTMELPDTSHLRQSGRQVNNPILQHIEKFNVFQYHEYFTWIPAVQGLLNQIKLLQFGINNSRTTDDYLLYQCLNALDNFWD